MKTKEENELNNIKSAVEIIAEKKKMPKDLKHKIDKTTLKNFLIAVLFMLIIVAIHISKLKIGEEQFYLIGKIVPLVMVSITIIIFEIAYKKDSGILCITGIEFLLFSICVLFIPHAYKFYDSKVIGYTKALPTFWAIYYVLKAIIIYIKREKNYKNNISDVKKIIKNEAKGYLDEESSKIIKERNIENGVLKETQKPLRKRKSEKDIAYENAKIKVSRAAKKAEEKEKAEEELKAQIKIIKQLQEEQNKENMPSDLSNEIKIENINIEKVKESILETSRSTRTKKSSATTKKVKEEPKTKKKTTTSIRKERAERIRKLVQEEKKKKGKYDK